METVSLKTRKEQSARNRPIRRVAVLGAGIMGSRIALHFANIGVPALLLDMAPQELSATEAKAGLTLDHPTVRNRIVTELYQAALKANPSPIYHPDVPELISLGNFEDDLHRVSEVDWIIEVVVERLDIKQNLFARIDQVRKLGSLVTTNTSGIPIRLLAEGRSEDFRRHFCGTHFFNPPRYLPLLEIIPSPETDPRVLDFLLSYGDLYLGKKTVLCKDTPAFIANRVGIFAICDLFHLTEKYGLRVEEVDLLTGPLIGHPKSATFRTCDVVGLDTAVKVAKGIAENCPDDERRDRYSLPEFIDYMVSNQMWGDKSGKGFYMKSTNAQGERVILSLNLQTKQYEEQIKPQDPILEAVRVLEDVESKFVALVTGKGRYCDFVREATYGLLAYVSHRVPEIADDLFRIDEAICAGFGWEIGPFRQWDLLGVRKTLDRMKSEGFVPAAWVEDMLAAGCETFYRIENGSRQYYHHQTRQYVDVPGQHQFIVLDNLRTSRVVWRNTGATLFDLGDGVLNLEFNTKLNTLGGDVLQAIDHAIDLAESSWAGLVIGNQGENFSAGANLMMILMMAVEQEFDELDFAIRTFQNTIMRVRYSAVPVVVAPHGLTLGGGCELTLHADRAVAAAETYIGLVEVGVGLIPAGGGTKEMTLRMSDRQREGDVELNVFRDIFMNIATAKVATSAFEAMNLGYLRPSVDEVVINKDRLLAEAKAKVLELAHAGYTQPVPRRDIRVQGRTGLGMVYAGTYQMQYNGYATEHDRKIADKIGWVMCGGDLSQPTEVSEQYLLDLEREAFLSLCGERKTLERIEHMLKTNKPLRN
jgi:3-hydroxyacyl-CoA dehydrogenase